MERLIAKIKVSAAGREEIIIFVKPKDGDVRFLKEIICELLGYPVHKQFLHFDGRFLDDPCEPLEELFSPIADEPEGYEVLVHVSWDVGVPIPASLKDPETGRLMENPHRCSDSCTYSFETLMKRLNGKASAPSPLVGMPLIRLDSLEPDIEKQAEIALFLESIQNSTAKKISSDVSDLGRFFEKLDEMRSDDLNVLYKSITTEEFQIPAVIVLGNECSGKSTLLERICMMPFFPRAAGVCTKMQIEVHLIRDTDNSNDACTLELLTLRNGTWETDMRHIIPVSEASDHVNTMMQGAVNTINDAGRKFLFDKKLRLNIRNNRVPNLVFRDLPGMVNFPPKDKEVIDRLIGEQINSDINNAIFLIVVSASDPDSALTQASALALCESKGDSMTSNAIGVLTHADKITDDTNFEKFKTFVSNGGADDPAINAADCYLYPHGWVMVSNRERDDMIGRPKFECLQGQADAEVEYFRGRNCEELMRHDREDGPRVGSDSLIFRIQRAYVDKVVDWSLGSIQKLKRKQAELIDEDIDLGLIAAHLPLGPGLEESFDKSLCYDRSLLADRRLSTDINLLVFLVKNVIEDSLSKQIPEISRNFVQNFLSPLQVRMTEAVEEANLCGETDILSVPTKISSVLKLTLESCLGMLALGGEEEVEGLYAKVLSSSIDSLREDTSPVKIGRFPHVIGAVGERGKKLCKVASERAILEIEAFLASPETRQLLHSGVTYRFESDDPTCTFNIESTFLRKIIYIVIDTVGSIVSPESLGDLTLDVRKMLELNLPEENTARLRSPLRQTISLIERIIEDTMYPLLDEACSSPSVPSILAILRNHHEIKFSLTKRALDAFSTLVNRAMSVQDTDRKALRFEKLREFNSIAAEMDSLYDEDEQFTLLKADILQRLNN